MSSPWLAFFWLVTLFSQDQWRLVHRDGSAVEAWGMPRLTAEQQAEVVSAWTWSSRRAPRRVAPARIGLERFSEDHARLDVRVIRRSDQAPPADLRILAAPVEMWVEVPEPALPSWGVPQDGRVAIPLDSERAWRLRVAGRGEGSWWVSLRPGQRSAVLTSAPAAGIEVEVLDPDGKTPGGLNASLQEAPGQSGIPRSWGRLHTAAGRLVVPGLPDDGEVSLSILSGDMAPLVLRGRPSVLPRQVRLAAGAELFGRLVDATGAPVADVSVQAEAWLASEMPQPLAVKARSGADGSWRLRGLPTGRVSWIAREPRFVPLTEMIDVQAGQRQDLGSRVLEPGNALAVRVIDDLGVAVPEARLRIDSARLMIQADGKGIARLEGLPAAPVEVKGSAAGHLAASARFNHPFPADANLVLPRAFVLTGRLVDSSGDPILRGAARIHSRSCRTEQPLGDGGRFQLDLPTIPEPSELVVRSPQTQELRLRIQPGEAGEVRDLGDLRAPVGLTVTGRVARTDGTPVPGARVWTTRQGPEGPAVAWATRDLLEVQTEDEGRFQLSGLLPAPAILRVEAAGFARAQLALPFDRGSDDGAASAAVDLGTIALSAGATLRVRLDSRERDNQGAVARADLGNQWLEPDMLTAQVWDGQASFPNVPAGKVTVSVVAGRRLVCEETVVVQEGGDQEVGCRRSAYRVSGLVKAGGAPAVEGTLSWRAPGLEVPSRIGTVISPGGLRHQQIAGGGRPQVSVPVGPDGRFETDELFPGHWRVLWRLQGSASAEIDLDVPPGERFDTVLSFPGLAVSGIVADPKGRPAEGARVREMVSGALAFAGADGSFSLIGLKHGRAIFQAQLQELSSPLAEVELREDQVPEPLHLVLGERSAPKVTIQVTNGDGLPMPNAFVFLEEEGRGRQLLVAHSDGRATAGLQPPLAPRMRAAAFAAGSWGFGPWVDWKTATLGLAIEVGGGGSLLVKSEKHRGSPRILTQDGWDLSWLLRLLGAPPAFSPDQPLQVTGLAPGLYEISFESARITLAVPRDRLVEGRLE